MKLIFIDESGYSFNWLNEIDSQPFYVLSGVTIDASIYTEACRHIQKRVKDMNVGLEYPLGKGSEIKANQLAAGRGWWKDHNVERNEFRDMMLTFPRTFDGTAFLIVIDKEKHRNKYAHPKNPVEISMQFLFERIEWYLRGVGDTAYCIYDNDTARTDALQQQAVGLIREGSTIRFHSPFWEQIVTSKYSLESITEMALCVSHNSLGLQVADFFATFAYRYYRDLPTNCGWWETLRGSLYRKDDELDGCGLKVFP